MRLRYVIIFVSDVARSVAFYRDLVGLVVQEGKASAEIALGEQTLVLQQAHVDDRSFHHPPMLAGSSRLGFLVPEMESIHARLVAAGVRCLSGPEREHDLCVALYEDPDGINFTIASPRRPDGCQ